MSGRILALLVAASLAPGCGTSDEDAVKTAVRDYFAAFAEADGQRACDFLSAAAKRDLANYAAEQLPEVGSVQCAEVTEQVVELTDEDALKRLEDVEVTSVEIDGDTATAEIVGATQTANLEKIDGDWKIAELDFGNPSGASVPDQEEAPPAAEEVKPTNEGGEAITLIKGRLQGAGYTVRKVDAGSGDAVGALEVPLAGGGQVKVYRYSSFTDAAKSEVELDVVEKESPDQVRVQAEGMNVYVGTIEEPARLPAEAFQEIVRAAEG